MKRKLIAGSMVAMMLASAASMAGTLTLNNTIKGTNPQFSAPSTDIGINSATGTISSSIVANGAYSNVDFSKNPIYHGGLTTTETSVLPTHVDMTKRAVEAYPVDSSCNINTLNNELKGFTTSATLTITNTGDSSNIKGHCALS